MNPWFTLVLGLLLGWLIEWLIDYFYWRRRYAEQDAAKPRLDESIHRASAGIATETQLSMPARPAAPAVPDNLQKIKGIGPVIERKLNEAGISTFEQLGNLTPSDLRQILGDVIERLADEESLLQQARDFAQKK